MEIVEGKAGPVGYDLALIEGKVQIKITTGVEGVTADLAIAVDAGHFLDKLKALIPGTIDDAIIDALKVAFLK